MRGGPRPLKPSGLFPEGSVPGGGANGGLGGAVAEVLLEAGFSGKFKRVGLPDEFAVLGDTDQVYRYYGMDPEGIARTVKELLK